MMNDARFLRADTILKAFADAGARVAVVTAKDKLRALLAKGLEFASGARSPSPPKRRTRRRATPTASTTALAFVGQPLPAVYSRGAVGIRLRRRRQAARVASVRTSCICRRPTTSSTRHAPGAPAANAFYAMVDRYIGALDAAGAVVVADRRPRHERQAPRRRIARRPLSPGPASTSSLGAGEARVILPITDPYVVHHGALGSFATIYLPAGRRPRERSSPRSPPSRASRRRWIARRPCARFELPPDRIGDIVVRLWPPQGARHDALRATTSPASTSRCVRTAASWEQRVPMIVNRRLAARRPSRCAISTPSTSRSIAIAR